MSQYNFSLIDSQQELDSIIQEAQWSKDGAQLELSQLQRDQAANATARGKKQESLQKAQEKLSQIMGKINNLPAGHPERVEAEAYRKEAEGRVDRIQFESNKSEGELKIREQRAIHLLEAAVTENNAILAGAQARKTELGG